MVGDKTISEETGRALARRKSKSPAGGTGPRDRAEGIDYGPLDGWVGFNLRMAQAATFQAFSRRSKDIGARPGRFATLMLIGQNPGISQTALSRANGRDKSTLTPLLADFVRRGLIRRTRTRTDRRSYRLTLTPAGRRMLQQFIELARVHERNLDRIIGPHDRAQFIRILRRITAEIA